jgi:molecular chaperone DnaJ
MTVRSRETYGLMSIRDSAVTFVSDEECQACGGRGGLLGIEGRRCPACRGNGRLRLSSGLGRSQVLRIEVCADCAGRGHIVDRACPECSGVGRVTTRRTRNARLRGAVDESAPVELGEESKPDGDPPARIDPGLVSWAAAVLLVCGVALLAYFIVSS